MKFLIYNNKHLSQIKKIIETDDFEPLKSNFQKKFKEIYY